MKRVHTLATKLPFDYVSPIYEQDPPAGKTEFEVYEHPFRLGNVFISRKRADGLEELVDIPATHAVFFHAHVEGAESASIGLAAHPPVVVHREDVVEFDEDGFDRSRLIGAGDPIEFPTRRRGYYSWHSFCKTQNAGNPKLGGDSNFLKAHLSLIELFDQMKLVGIRTRVRDDSKYSTHRNVKRLLRSLHKWDGIVAHLAGALSDAIGGEKIVAPIKDRADFEHIEAKGGAILKKIAARHKHRKRHGKR